MPVVLAGALVIAIELIVIALEVIIIAALIVLALYTLFVIGKAIWEWTQSFREAPPLYPPITDREIPRIQPQDIPINEPLVRPIPIPIPIAIPDTKVKPRRRNRDKDIWNVYDVHIVVPDEYREYNFGVGYSDKFLSVGQIYKYGITSFPRVILRYTILYGAFEGDKDKYLMENLASVKMAAKEWYLSKVKKIKAQEKEGQLIDAYRASHLGEYPPGNTKRG